MAIIIQSPGSSGGAFFRGAGQIARGYAAGIEAKTARRNTDAKTAQTIAATEKLQQETEQLKADNERKAFADEQRRKLYEELGETGVELGSDVPELLKREWKSDQWQSPMAPASPVDSVPNVSSAYYDPSLADLRTSTFEPNNSIEGVWQTPQVQAALAGNEELERAMKIARLPDATTAERENAERLIEMYRGGIESALAEQNELAYNKNKSAFLSITGSSEDIELSAAWSDRIEGIVRNAKDDATWPMLNNELMEAQSDFHEIAHARRLEKMYLADMTSLISGDKWAAIESNMMLGDGVDEDDVSAVRALINSANAPVAEFQLTNSDGKNSHVERLQQVSLAYDMVKIAEAGKSEEWMPAASANMQIEAMGNLLQAQATSFQSLQDGLRVGEEWSDAFVIETGAAYRDAPVPEGMSGEQEHAFRFKFAVDSMDAKMAARGKQGLTDDAYGWVFRQAASNRFKDRLPESKVAAEKEEEAAAERKKTKQKEIDAADTAFRSSQRTSDEVLNTHVENSKDSKFERKAADGWNRVVQSDGVMDFLDRVSKNPKNYKRGDSEPPLPLSYSEPTAPYYKAGLKNHEYHKGLEAFGSLSRREKELYLTRAALERPYAEKTSFLKGIGASTKRLTNKAGRLPAFWHRDLSTSDEVWKEEDVARYLAVTAAHAGRMAEEENKASTQDPSVYQDRQRAMGEGFQPQFEDPDDAQARQRARIEQVRGGR